MPSRVFASGALEFRCASKNGTTQQDLLPPSIHPDTGLAYRWEFGEPLLGDWRNPPPLPEALRALWREEEEARCASTSRCEIRIADVDVDRLREQLKAHNPDCDYHQWIRVGMILHHATQGSDVGLELWNEWSAKSNDKYQGKDDLIPHWRSFRVDSPNPVTAASLRTEHSATADEFGTHDADPRQVIRLAGGELHNYAVQCEDLLRDELYVRERSLVRIGGARELTPEDGSEVRRDDDQAVILPAGMEYLRRRLNQRVRFKRYRRREKEWAAIDCPKDLAINIAGQGDWPNLRRLTAIARAPFVRSDGTVCETLGYDAASRVFYAPNASFPSVPESPTRAESELALATLLEPFSEFPFATDASRSASVANILTEAVRAAIDASPAFFYTAPTPGTGKTLLSEMPTRIVHGCGPAMRPWAEGGEELRKSLFASLLAGDRTIGFDNLPNGVKVRSPILCGFLTADVYSDRKLGASEVPALPNRSVVSLTGNNITPAGDLARRSIVTRLDANTNRLRDRRFREPDLKGYVAAHRAALLIAALTIVKAYVAAGTPFQAIPLPSFERWSRFARDPLLWLGMPDPVATQDDETDDEAVPLAAAFLMIAECPALGEKEFMASELALACDALVGDSQLAAAIEPAGCSAASDQKYVGYWLREKRDHIAGGYKLERGHAANGSRKWRLRKIPC